MSNKLTNVTTLVAGDWSGDGHSRTDTTVIRSNLTSEQIGEAYEAGSKKLGFNFIDEVAVDYEDNSLDLEKLQTLIAAGMNVEEAFKFEYEINEVKTVLKDEDPAGIHLCEESFTDIYFFIVKLGNEDFEYEISKGNSINIGGYGLFE
jgi:hypothetical protein